MAKINIINNKSANLDVDTTIVAGTDITSTAGNFIMSSPAATAGASTIPFIQTSNGLMSDATGGAVTLNTGTQTLGISTDASATTLSIGTGAAAKAVTVGSTNTTSALTLNSGSGGIIATGVASVVVSNKNYVTIDTATGELGSDNAPITSLSITGDSGGALAPTAGNWDILGGLNTVTSGAASTLTIAATPDQYLTSYRVANASPFVVNSTDFYITVDTSTIPITIQLPDAPTVYRRFIIKDSAGNASAQNITVTTVGGLLNIDAATTFVMNSDYQAIELMYSGFGYEIF